MKIYFVYFLLCRLCSNSNRKLLFPFSRMANEIYAPTFITRVLSSSKNPTEWSFTWIAFNRILAFSSLLLALSSSVHLPEDFFISLQNIYLWSSTPSPSHPCWQFIVVYQNIFKWNSGSKHHEELQFTTSKVPQFSLFYSPTERLLIERVRGKFLHLLRIQQTLSPAGAGLFVVMSLTAFSSVFPSFCRRQFFPLPAPALKLLLHCLNGSYILTI